MKRQLLLLTLGLFSFLMVNAQKENGTVYSEHESIKKTKDLWEAFKKGDKEAFTSFFADTVYVVRNGTLIKRLKKEMGGGIEWWQGVENFTIKDDTPAFPDAINYKVGGLWVQDWLRITGTHKKTGFNIDLPVHNLYSFNKEGKIRIFHQYFDTSIFEKINNSLRTIENGTVYINHPYILTVRKLINAYCAKDVETLKSFYSPKASFWKSDFKGMKMISLEEKMKENESTFSTYNNIMLKQVGYPDCIYYLKDDNYIVYSWWILSFTTTEGKKKSDIPVMLSHEFDKEGKITSELVYVSSNHFQ